jgi:polyisoprenoid-binding protein YceI
VTFASRSVDVAEDGAATVEGDLTIKGITRPVTATGTWTPAAEDAFGNTRAHLTLEATVDRTEFDMNWNMPLPSGGTALANDVTITIDASLTQA